jgi:hypothetical protein
MAPSLLFRAVVLAAVCYSGARAKTMQYTVTADDIYADDGHGLGFFDKFDFFTVCLVDIDHLLSFLTSIKGSDPTNGYVDYKGRVLASSLGLIKTVGGRPQMLVDSVTDLTGIDTSVVRGRASVRIQSKKIYNGGLFIADIEHMPGMFESAPLIGNAKSCLV